MLVWDTLSYIKLAELGYKRTYHLAHLYSELARRNSAWKWLKATSAPYVGTADIGTILSTDPSWSEKSPLTFSILCVKRRSQFLQPKQPEVITV
jgi:hypothetical protein